MDNSAIIQEFISYLKFEKHFSEHTAKCYHADLEQFVSFLADAYSGHASPSDHPADNPWDTTS
ncbi:MAG TPA: site-specific integrase, partial [Anaerohalosphaeraceae bacterium]|nr:site-specific integrase [Anaerohalosphaeraceae bacterium]